MRWCCDQAVTAVTCTMKLLLLVGNLWMGVSVVLFKTVRGFNPL
jgi:hypothetical protein